MKKLLTSIIIAFIISTGAFAEQLCKCFSLKGQNSVNITEQINYYINNGWKVVSMTSVSTRHDRYVDSGLTTSIIVVFER